MGRAKLEAKGTSPLGAIFCFTASAEFRCGDTCFISTLAREHGRRMQKGAVVDLLDEEIRHIGPRDETACPVAWID